MTFKKKLGISAIILAAVLMASLYWPVPESELSSQSMVSFRILDRNGQVLREILSDQSGSCRWLDREHIPRKVVITTLAAEDRFFYFHPGVNVFSMARALWQNISQGQIVSGASTITQQVARNIHPHPRTLLSKIREAWTALRLEKTFSKDQILTQYLNRIYYGNRAYGIEAATQIYFGKSCEDLSLAEAAFLAALPRSPERFHPSDTDPRIKRIQRELLYSVFQSGMVSEFSYLNALKQKITLKPLQARFLAPHFCDFVLARCRVRDRTSGRDIMTTLDHELNQDIQNLVKKHVTSLADRNITQAAVVVLDNAECSILSMVGSADFFDAYHHGQVNGAVSLRQPGSALKPFTYGLALQQGISAGDIIYDGPVEYSTPSGPYQPANYDQKFHGSVRLRQALACSYNVPAVQITENLGTERLLLKLKQAGFTSLAHSSPHYGVGLTLGNGEVTLLELAQAYSALSRQGTYLPVRWRDSLIPESVRIFSPEISYILTHILSDPDARIPAFGYRSSLRLPFPCAVKTGTSKDFRDNWAVGYTPEYTVGIWAGNFSGEPMHTVSGVTGCGPLFRSIMLLLHHKNIPPPFRKPENIIRKRICPESGMLASASCPGSIEEIFIPGTEPGDVCRRHSANIPIQQNFSPAQAPQVHMVHPTHGNLFQMDPVLKPEFQTISLRAVVPAETKIKSFEWLANGRIVAASPHYFEFLWHLIPGVHTLSFKVRTASGKVIEDSATITVLE